MFLRIKLSCTEYTCSREVLGSSKHVVRLQGGHSRAQVADSSIKVEDMQPLRKFRPDSI